jgi:hypothetical protein
VREATAAAGGVCSSIVNLFARLAGQRQRSKRPHLWVQRHGQVVKKLQQQLLLWSG